MYLRKITVKDIKSFSNLELDFTTSTGQVKKWTTLFGSNGLGKSTLLQAIGVALAGPYAIRELIPVAENWVRQHCDYGEIIAELAWSSGDEKPQGQPRKHQLYTVRYIVTGSNPEKLPQSLTEREFPTTPTIVTWSGDGDAKSKGAATTDLRQLQKTAYAENKQGWLACGYGPFRRLSGSGRDVDLILNKERISARFVTLFREDAAINNAESWLVTLHNTARDGDKKSEKALEKVRQAFATDLFPEATQLLVDARAARLQVGDREPMALDHLSDGYRSMLALAIDLLRWLILAFPDAEDPMHCSGIVLIDELDAHLHPKWQRQIGPWLRQKFPNLQFIVATHSPFVAQVADIDDSGMQVTSQVKETSQNIYLRATETGVVAYNDLGPVHDLRIDQILVGPLFGMETLYSPAAELKFKRHEDLSIKVNSDDKLTAAEQKEFEQLELWRERIPVTTSFQDQSLELELQEIIDRSDKKLLEIE